MSLEALVTMGIILTLVWGGLLFCLVRVAQQGRRKN